MKDETLLSFSPLQVWLGTDCSATIKNKTTKMLQEIYKEYTEFIIYHKSRTDLTI